MPNVILPNLGIELPDVGSDQDTWGDILNADLQKLDNAVQYDVISKTLAGVDVTLTDVEAASAVINLTGTLTANVNVIVPATPVRVYLVRNQTSGAFTVTVKTAAGTGTPVQQGTSSLVYSDGTNIIQGATSVNGSFAVSGALTAGSLNNTPVGNTTPSSGAFTTLSASGATTLQTASATNLSYTGTLTGGTGVINIGSGQIYKDASGNVVLGGVTQLDKLTINTNTNGFAGVYVTGNQGGIAEQMGYRAINANGTGIFLGVNGANYSSGIGNPNGAVIQALGSGTSLSVATNGATRLTIDPAGNAGLGVTPSAWNAAVKALDMGQGSAFLNPGSTAQTWVYNNAYLDSANANRYKNTAGGAAWYQQVEGTHAFHTAPSGTAGNPITFTQALTLTQAGQLLLGATSLSAGAFAEFTSTTGALIVPRMTTAQRDAIGAVANGAIIYNTTTNKMNFRENGAWVQPTVTAA